MSPLRLIIMGVGGVGKSAIANRFVQGRWIERYDPTVEESYQTIVDVDGKALQVEILDTAGQDEYTPLRETFMHTGDGFMLVYSITDDQTLEEIRSIREQVLRVHKDRKVPMLVVGNKVDLAARERAVSAEEGRALADDFGAAFIEVSAKSQVKIKEAFDLLLRRVLARSPKSNFGAADSTVGGVFGAGKVDNTVEAEEAGGGAEEPRKTSTRPTSGGSPGRASSRPGSKKVDNAGCGARGMCVIL